MSSLENVGSQSDLSSKKPVFWRSAGELENTPEFRALAAREFPDQDPATLPPWTRRHFMQLMGASVALAAASGCYWEQDHLIPMKELPEGYVPGQAKHFASSFELMGVATGVHVKSFNGRPIKIEGNPNHPDSLGASGIFAQAAILEVYDPDRSTPGHGTAVAIAKDGTSASLDEAIAKVRDGLKTGSTVVLCEPSSSPSQAVLKKAFLAQIPQARWFEYTPVSWQNRAAGTKLAFGKTFRIHYDLEKADVLLALDDDLLQTGPASLRLARQFARRRRPEAGEMNRLYVVESQFSVTGAQADHRVPLQSSKIGAFVQALGAKLGISGFSGTTDVDPKVVDALVSDLQSSKGKSLITVGLHQPPVVHALVAKLNAELGNAGLTVKYSAASDEPPYPEQLKNAAAAIANAGTVLILGGNPAYDTPGSLSGALASALKSSKANTLHLSLYRNETSILCRWQIPQAHWLETWGDGQGEDGTYTLQQPIIAPLYHGKSTIELLSLLCEETPRSGHAIVVDTFKETTGSEFSEKLWRKALHDGVFGGTAYSTETPAVQSFAVSTPEVAKTEIVFLPDSKVFDGRFANSGWLQELPDFITKLTWDNAALLSPALAKSRGVKTGDVISVSANGRSLEAPVYVLNGVAENTVILPLGYGRTHAGSIAGHPDLSTRLGGFQYRVDSVGFNAYALLGDDQACIVAGEISPTGRKFDLSITQEHHVVDKVGMEGRMGRMHELIREQTQTSYRKHPDHAKHVVHHPTVSLWKDPVDYSTGYKWGMTIDLSTCTGCMSCVISCQAENNIPIVGKTMVARSREMHWIRIDRYFKSADPDAANPQVAHQPMTCHHCENAPCEQVCPVAATVHSHEGLNDMVYNRCIGTRYCSNNCPYKVRRFNYLHYNDDVKYDKRFEVAQLRFNPDVSVRARGVMEKCTFCVQRIVEKRIEAKNEGRKVKDGEIRVACQQACPTEAIQFGDLNDKGSRVALEDALPRSYHMLSELNVRPRLSYLAKIRNPHPSLAVEEKGHDEHGKHVR